MYVTPECNSDRDQPVPTKATPGNHAAPVIQDMAVVYAYVNVSDVSMEASKVALSRIWSKLSPCFLHLVGVKDMCVDRVG